MNIDEFVKEKFEEGYWDILNNTHSSLIENNSEYKDNSKRMSDISGFDKIGNILEENEIRPLTEEETKLVIEYINLLRRNQTIMNQELLITGIKLERKFKKLLHNNDSDLGE